MGDEHSTANGPGIVPDIDVECNVVVEYGYALASAAERCLRYPELLRGAGSEDERDHIRAQYFGFIRRVVGANTIAIAALGELPGNVTKETP